MPKQVARLSPGEWEIMQVIWKRKPAMSVRQVLEIACPRSEKAYTTIQTVMNNLEQKGYLKRDKIGLVNFYKSTRSRKDTVKKETQTFVKKVFDGSFQALANYLVESDSLNPENIAQLKKMIRDKEKELGS